MEEAVPSEWSYISGETFQSASVLRVLPGSDLGPRSAGVQMYSVQATSAQEMSQGGAQTMLECATATTTADAKHRIANDRQKRRSTTA